MQSISFRNGGVSSAPNCVSVKIKRFESFKMDRAHEMIQNASQALTHVFKNRAAQSAFNFIALPIVSLLAFAEIVVIIADLFAYIVHSIIHHSYKKGAAGEFARDLSSTSLRIFAPLGIVTGLALCPLRFVLKKSGDDSKDPFPSTTYTPPAPATVEDDDPLYF